MTPLPGWGWEGELLYKLEIPEETPSNNVIKGMHFQAYRTLRRLWRFRVISALEGKRPKTPIERSAIVIVRHCAGYLDWDNALGGLKPLLDCLVIPSARNPDGLGLIKDDNPVHMPFPPYMQQVKAKRGQGRTEVLVYRLGEPELSN